MLGLLKQKTEEEAREFALELDGDELTSCGECEWVIDSITKDEDTNEVEDDE